MPGPPDAVTVEIEFTAGAWTDVTTDVSAPDKVTVRAGRPTEFDEVGPAACTVVLRNAEGKYTPDSGGSPYYPNVVEGRRIRVTITRGGTPYRLFTGPILSWEPAYADANMAFGTVTVAANDALSLLALHTLDSRWVEETRVRARAATTWADVWALSGDASTAGLNNIGVTTGAPYGVATVVPNASAAGNISFGAPDALLVESAATFGPANGYGPVIAITPAAAPASVSFWLQVPADTVPGSDAVPFATPYVLALWGAGGELGSLRLYNNAGVCALGVYDPVGVLLGTLSGAVADGAWRLVTLTAAPGPATTIAATTTAGDTATVAASFNLAAATTLYLGGESAAGTDRCAPMLVAGLTAAGAAAVTPPPARALPGQTSTQLAAYAALQTYCPEVTSWATLGGEVRTIGEPAWAGSTALDVLQTIARTINGVAYCRGDGTVVLAMADVVRPSISAATLDVEQDIDRETAMPTLRRAADSRPTRVTIDYAGGTTTLIDAAAEANGQPRREAQLKTCAADVAGAAFAGQYLLVAANGLRITQVAVDLTTSVQDLWAVFLGLYPTQRVVIAGFNAALLGTTTQVVYVQGWQVTVDHDRVVYVLDCSPAAQFVSASWDAGDEYGRWSAGTTMTVTGGTAVGTTGNGTLTLTTAGGPGLSTAPGDYPLVLDWNGEYVQVTSPPVSATSPQTVTTTARGVFPTTARAGHTAGEPIDLFHAAVWGF